MLKLIIEDDEGRKTVVPFVRDEITIGRQEGNTIRLTERNVSRRHARLMRADSAVLIEDLGSYNGVRINGDRIAGQVQVGDGDLIQIGDYDLAIEAEDVAATVPLDTARVQAATARLPEPASATQPALPMVDVPGLDAEDAAASAAAPAPEQAEPRSTAVVRPEQVEQNRKRTVVALDASEAPRLVVLNTDLAGREFRCSRTELKIGRTDDNDIALDHRSLSRVHCKVVREDTGEWRVIDLQSANGLLVNGEPYSQATLRFGDTLELGHVKLHFLAPGDDAPAVASPSGLTAAAPGPGSRAPLYAVLGAVAVVLVGGGGYALWKGRGGSLAATPPAPAPAPSSPEASAQALAARLNEAREAITALEWDRATALLNECKVGSSLAPEAQRLLTQLGAEKGMRDALVEAERLLDAGDADKARPLLDQASGSTLLADRFGEALTRYDTLVTERLEVARPVPANQAPPPPAPTPVAAPPRPRARLAEAQKCHEEGVRLEKEKKLRAAQEQLEKCLQLVPDYYQCHKVLGSVLARIVTREGGSKEDYQRAVESYQRFLDLAPADDPDVPKVRNILAAQNDQPAVPSP